MLFANRKSPQNFAGPMRSSNESVVLGHDSRRSREVRAQPLPVAASKEEVTVGASLDHRDLVRLTKLTPASQPTVALNRDDRRRSCRTRVPICDREKRVSHRGESRNRTDRMAPAEATRRSDFHEKGVLREAFRESALLPDAQGPAGQ